CRVSGTELAGMVLSLSTHSFMVALQATDARVVALLLDGGMSPTVLHKGTAAALYILQPLLPDPIPMLKLMIAKGYDVNATLTDEIGRASCRERVMVGGVWGTV